MTLVLGTWLLLWVRNDNYKLMSVLVWKLLSYRSQHICQAVAVRVARGDSQVKTKYWRLVTTLNTANRPGWASLGQTRTGQPSSKTSHRISRSHIFFIRETFFAIVRKDRSPETNVKYEDLLSRKALLHKSVTLFYFNNLLKRKQFSQN